MLLPLLLLGGRKRFEQDEREAPVEQVRLVGQRLVRGRLQPCIDLVMTEPCTQIQGCDELEACRSRC